MPKHARAFYDGGLPMLYLGPGRMFGMGNTTPIPNTIYAIPFDIIMPIDRVAIYNKAAVEATPCRLGLYENDPTRGIPGALIYGSDEFEMTSGHNGAREFVLPEVYQMTGTEWVAAFFSEVAPVLCDCNVPFQSQENQEIFGHEQYNESAQFRNCVKVEEMTFGPMPDPFPNAVALGGFTKMAIWIRAPDLS